VVPRSSRLASPLALTVAALLVVALAFQNSTLREELRTLRRRAEVVYARAGSFRSQGVFDSIIAAARAPQAAPSDTVTTG
jgi:hypothetical protein